MTGRSAHAALNYAVVAGVTPASGIGDKAAVSDGMGHVLKGLSGATCSVDSLLIRRLEPRRAA